MPQACQNESRYRQYLSGMQATLQVCELYIFLFNLKWRRNANDFKKNNDILSIFGC